MSRKDGKSNLVGGKEKRGVYRVDVEDEEYGANTKASKNCASKVITIEKIK